MQTKAMTMTTVGRIIILLACYLAAIEAQSNVPSVADGQDLQVTSHTDDYFQQNQRQYAANIVSMNAQLDAYKSNYENQLATMSTQSELLQANLIEVDKRLLPLEMLNDLSKHCVQKYKSKIATVASVRSTISQCVTSAQASYPGIITNIQNTITTLNNWYNNQLLNLIGDCKKLHSKSQLNYTICVTKTIATADSQTSANMKLFNNQMQDTTCSGGSRVKQAVNCAFTTVYTTTAKVGEITRLIDNCIEGKEFCPPCTTPPPPTTTPAPTKSCPKEVTVQMSEADYKNATITNPFLGLNSTIPCVEVQFKLVSKKLNEKK